MQQRCISLPPSQPLTWISLKNRCSRGPFPLKRCGLKTLSAQSQFVKRHENTSAKEPLPRRSPLCTMERSTFKCSKLKFSTRFSMDMPCFLLRAAARTSLCLCKKDRPPSILSNSSTISQKVGLFLGLLCQHRCIMFLHAGSMSSGMDGRRPLIISLPRTMPRSLPLLYGGFLDTVCHSGLHKHKVELVLCAGDQ